jgi:hypothetical protein
MGKASLLTFELFRLRVQPLDENLARNNNDGGKRQSLLQAVNILFTHTG